MAEEYLLENTQHPWLMSSLGKKKYKGGMEKGEIRKKMDKEQR
jgi:hypothetical protein